MNLSRKTLERGASLSATSPATTTSTPDGGTHAPFQSSHTKPVLLDLFCCQGGAGMGYHRAGFEVVGVDSIPQPKYPFTFFQMDALAFLGSDWSWSFDAIHASPPCQAYSATQRIQKNHHPDLIASLRNAIKVWGVPYVIENVPGSPLNSPTELCGAMFPPLKVYRHRWFETSFPLPQPPHVPHTAPQVKMGRQPTGEQFIQPVGNFTDADAGREAMGMPWATRDGLREAIPPSYTEWIGRFLMAEVREPQRSLAA